MGESERWEQRAVATTWGLSRRSSEWDPAPRLGYRKGDQGIMLQDPLNRMDGSASA